MRSALLTLALLALVAGCQTLDSSQPADWFMKGRVIIRTPDQAERLNIAWRQYQDQSDILFTGPLGASVAKIYSSDTGYQLERPGYPEQSADTLEALLFSVTGTQIPVSMLLPVLQGELLASENGDWRISTSESDDAGRPLKLLIESTEVTIKITVTEWK